MRVFEGFDSLPEPSARASVAVGNFDGVHLGHRRILAAVVADAAARGTVPAVVTFVPHPLRVLAPERAPRMIQTLEARLERLEEAGADRVVVVPFTQAFSRVSAASFVEDLLVRRLGCDALFLGGDARFGAGREGDAAFLARYERAGVFTMQFVPPEVVDGVRVSSSGVRKRVAAGDMEGAAAFLGRPFAIRGTVVTGAGRGHTLGFPTANLAVDGETLPGQGVYAADCRVSGVTWRAAVHVGPLPTFDSTVPVVEAHLIGFSGHLVGQRLELAFLSRIRGVERFDGPEALRVQIALDVEEAARRP